MELIKKEKSDDEFFYYVDSLDTLGNIKEIIGLIEEDGYVINKAKINFIYDHATLLAPKSYTKSSDLLEDLKNIELEDIDMITYNAEKGSAVRQGFISLLNKVISCAEFKKRNG